MREALRRLLGPEARLQSSYLPGRSGFLITSKRPLSELRLALMPRWACRLYIIHEESGRYFLEPSSGLLVRSLSQDRPELWWSPAHQRASQEFFDPVRAERLRRLALLGEGRADWTRGYRGLRELSLRLESLHATPRPDKHWRGLAEAFDDLWRGTRISTLAPNPLWCATLDHLCRCRARATPGIGLTRSGA